MPSREGRAYQWVLVTLLSLNFGVVFFDRNALGYLMFRIQPELHLSETQVGELGSALSLSWALAGLFVGRLSDALGNSRNLRLHYLIKRVRLGNLSHRVRSASRLVCPPSIGAQRRLDTHARRSRYRHHDAGQIQILF